jgi:hypothetical protein
MVVETKAVPAATIEFGLIAFALAATPRSAQAMSALQAFIPASESASAALAAWLDRQIGCFPEDEPPPVAAWSMPVAGKPAEDAPLATAIAGRLALDPRSRVALRRLLNISKETRLVVFVEDPVAALSGWIRDESIPAAKLEAQLQSWCEAARLLLDGLPEGRDRLTLAAIDDVGPDAAAALAAKSLGIVADFPPAATPRQADGPRAGSAALSWSLADTWVADVGADVLFGRLLSACVRPTEPRNRRQLRALAPHADVTARVDGVVLLRDVQATLAELERLAGHDAASTSDSRASLRHAVARVAREAELQRDNELLNTLLQQMYEAIERPVAAPAPVPKSASPAQPLPAAQAHHGFKVHIGDEHLQPPHRHLDFVARTRTANGSVANLAGRLIEHHGRVGLLLFSDDAALVLARWVETGDEGGRGFMLVIPQDQSGATLIRTSPSPDFRLWTELVDAIRRSLSSSSPSPRDMFWHGAAGRLLDLLASAGDGLHWGAVQVQATGASDVKVVIDQLTLGAVHAPPLHLRWQQTGPDAGIELVRDDDAGTPWPASWPIDPQGRSSTAWRLPIGPALTPTAKRSAWASITPGDRRWLLAIIAAVPEIVQTGSTGGDGALEVGRSQRRQIASWVREAERLSQPPAWMRWLRWMRDAWRARFVRGG